MESNPVCFQYTHDVLTNVKFPSLMHATAYGAAAEILCFLRVLGYTRDTGVGKVFELVPDIEDIVMRNDRTALLLVYDGAALRMYRSEDHEKLAEIERQAAVDDHSVLIVVPQHLRKWLEETGYVCH
jgi:hypothetical protein